MTLDQLKERLALLERELSVYVARAGSQETEDVCVRDLYVDQTTARLVLVIDA